MTRTEFYIFTLSDFSTIEHEAIHTKDNAANELLQLDGYEIEHCFRIVVDGAQVTSDDVSDDVFKQAAVNLWDGIYKNLETPSDIEWEFEQACNELVGRYKRECDLLVGSYRGGDDFGNFWREAA